MSAGPMSERARTAWCDAAALELDRTALGDNAARLLFALRGIMLQMIQGGDFGLFERDSAVVEARAAILAAQGGRVLP